MTRAPGETHSAITAFMGPSRESGFPRNHILDCRFAFAVFALPEVWIVAGKMLENLGCVDESPSPMSSWKHTLIKVPVLRGLLFFGFRAN